MQALYDSSGGPLGISQTLAGHGPRSVNGDSQVERLAHLIALLRCLWRSDSCNEVPAAFAAVHIAALIEPSFKVVDS